MTNLLKRLLLASFLPALLLSAVPKRISSIEFKGNFTLKSAELKRNLGINEGELFNQLKISRSVKQLQAYLIDKGYLYARLDSVVFKAQTADTAQLNMVVFVNTGPQALFGQISLACDSLDKREYLQIMTIKEDDPYSEKILQRNVNAFLSYSAEKGFPFAAAEIKEPTLKQEGEKLHAAVSMRIREGAKTFIKEILLRGNRYTKDKVILRESGLSKGDVYSSEKIRNIKRRLDRLGIFKETGEAQVLKADADSVYLLINIKEGNATRFDGVVGYIPPASSAKADGYFTGLLDLTFANLFGTARRFSLHWKKIDRNSEEFLLAYREPWVLDYPLDVGIGLERRVRDTSYIEWKNQLDFRLRLFNNFTLLGNINRTSVNPDSLASRTLRLARNEIFNGELGIEYDTRDYYLNPRRGLYYKSSYSFGIKKNYGPSYLLSQDSLSKRAELHSIKVELAGYYNLWSNQVLAVETHLRQVKGRRLQLSDYFWFGGSRSLRGYRENQFSGDIVAWSNLEYRFVLGRNTRLFLFNDWGYYQNALGGRKREKILPGYGLGFRFQTPLGILGVDYGLGKGDSFSQGKIHFGLINTF